MRRPAWQVGPGLRLDYVLRMRRALLFVILFLLAVATPVFAFGWSLVNAAIRREFADVPRITTAELAAWLADDRRPAPLLLDVRTHPEFAVSHLRNAQQVDPGAAASAVSVSKDRPIVTYCSVGYRSSKFAEKLRRAGYSKVQNLEGSIFMWANEGRPVFRGSERVEKVHPFNGTWGLLLEKKYRAPVTSD